MKKGSILFLLNRILQAFVRSTSNDPYSNGCLPYSFSHLQTQN